MRGEDGERLRRTGHRRNGRRRVGEHGGGGQRRRVAYDARGAFALRQVRIVNRGLERALVAGRCLHPVCRPRAAFQGHRSQGLALEPDGGNQQEGGESLEDGLHFANSTGSYRAGRAPAVDAIRSFASLLAVQRVEFLGIAWSRALPDHRPRRRRGPSFAGRALDQQHVAVFPGTCGFLAKRLDACEVLQ